MCRILTDYKTLLIINEENPSLHNKLLISPGMDLESCVLDQVTKKFKFDFCIVVFGHANRNMLELEEYLFSRKQFFYYESFLLN